MRASWLCCWEDAEHPISTLAHTIKHVLCAACTRQLRQSTAHAHSEREERARLANSSDELIFNDVLAVCACVRWFASQGGQAVIQEQKGDHVMEKVVLVHPSAKASVEVYLQGATVTSWKILGQELLYLSPKASFAPNKAIRGGIPVVFRQTRQQQRRSSHSGNSKQQTD